MKTHIVSFLAAAVALATVACSPAMITPESIPVIDDPSDASAPVKKLAWREPIAMSEHPADAYVGSNMLITHQVRMALPEGWHFKRRKDEDPKGVYLWIHDTGGNAVTGAYVFKPFDFPISPTRATEFYASKGMAGYGHKEAHKTEIDGSEAHVVLGVSEETGQRRLSTLIYEGSRSSSAINNITLLVDPGYFAQNPSVPNAIANSFKRMPRQMSERRIKGSFSFKCDDGTLDWLNDSTRKWQSRGFSVIGKLGGELVIIDISQVATTRFRDFYKLEHFRPDEIQTELHFAGKVVSARAIVSGSRENENAQAVFFFKHEGKDYMLDIYRKLSEHGEVDAKNLYNDENIQRALDTSFYFDG